MLPLAKKGNENMEQRHHVIWWLSRLCKNYARVSFANHSGACGSEVPPRWSQPTIITGNQEREPRQGSKTGFQDGEPRQVNKTGFQDGEQRQETPRLKWRIRKDKHRKKRDREPRRETKTGNQDREPRWGTNAGNQCREPTREPRLRTENKKRQ